MSFQSVLGQLKSELEAEIATVSTDVKESRIALLSIINVALGATGSALSAQQTSDAVRDAIKVAVIGLHQSRTLSAESLETVTKPPGAQLLLFEIESTSSDLRMTLDGSAPSASFGFRCRAGERFSIKLDSGDTVRIYSVGPQSSVYQLQWGS